MVMTRKSYLNLALTSTLLICISAPLHANKVYKWTDENGRIHYSDIKPSHTKSQKIRISSSRSETTPPSTIDKAKKLEQKKASELQKKAELLKARSASKANDARCQSAQANLKKVNENSRIKIEENGEYRYLTPKEIQDKKDRYQKIIKENC